MPPLLSAVSAPQLLSVGGGALLKRSFRVVAAGSPAGKQAAASRRRAGRARRR